jgi:hypothetical protein
VREGELPVVVFTMHILYHGFAECQAVFGNIFFLQAQNCGRVSARAEGQLAGPCTITPAYTGNASCPVQVGRWRVAVSGLAVSGWRGVYPTPAWGDVWRRVGAGRRGSGAHVMQTGNALPDR